MNMGFFQVTFLSFQSAGRQPGRASRPCYPCRIGGSAISLLFVLVAAFPGGSLAAEPDQPGTTNSFPSLYDVLQGKVFPTDFDRDVFFLRAIHDRYSTQWPGFLQANITVDEYLHSPAKLLRFVNVLGNATAGSDDPVTITNLAAVTGDPVFYANTNGYVPEIQRAATKALINLGPNGRKTLVSCLGENHYRADTESLEDLMATIGDERPADSMFTSALAAVAFDFTTPSGGMYPRCTTAATTNLLRLPDGVAAVRARLKIENIFDNPGRFTAVTEGIAAVRATDLRTNLAAIEAEVKTRLGTLTNSPGAYQDDLQDLESRLRGTLAEFGKRGNDAR